MASSSNTGNASSNPPPDSIAGSTSSQASGPTPQRRRRPATPKWTWWEEVDCPVYGVGGGSRKWVCRLCGYSRTGGAHKVRAHLLHESGQEVLFCTNITPEKRRELLEKAAVLAAIDKSRQIPNVAVDPNRMGRPRVQPSMGRPGVQPTRPRQSTLEENWNPRLKQEVDMAVARFFYHDHIAFRAARSPYFREIVTKIGEYGASYVPPSSEQIRTTLLDKEKMSVEVAASSMKELWSTNGMTLVVDGWSDTRKRSIHGVVAYSRGEMYFVDSHDASGSGKTADVLAGEWAATLETLGAENVVAICADGEPANRAAGNILEGTYSHITVSFCMAHCLNNLIKDIGHLPWVEPVIEAANKMVTFVLNHTRIRHEFSKRSNLSLLKYSETRFAFNFLMLGRLNTCSGALRGLFISDEFLNGPEASTSVGMECRARADDTAWWDEVKAIDAMVKPIIDLLRIVDGMLPCIGKVYEAMDRMIEKLKVHITDRARYDEVKSMCVRRWNAYYSPLHAAAFMVDPEFQGNKQEKDKEVSSGFRIVLDRLEPDAGMRRKIRDQLQLYREKRGSFGLADAQIDRFKIGSALRWEDYGSDGPELQRFAIRVLSQSCSTSCLEQLWSVYSHIASKKRNRLGVQRANDLVFVSANLRMLCKGMSKKADPFTEWEQAQKDPAGIDEHMAEILEDLEVVPDSEVPTLPEPGLSAEEFYEPVEIQTHPDFV